MKSLLTALIAFTVLSFSTLALSAGTGNNTFALSPEEIAAQQAAADAAKNVAASVTSDLRDGATIIKETFDSIVRSISNFQKTFANQIASNNYGGKLLAGLSLIAFAWMGIQMVLQGESAILGLMANVILLGMRVGFAYFLMNEGYHLVVEQGIIGSMDKLAQLALPVAGNQVSEGFNMFMQQEFGLIGVMLDALGKMSMWEMVFSALPTIIIMIVLTVMMLISSIIGMVVSMAVLVSIAIALCLGPIMIPWLVLDQTSYIFDGWLKFTITAALTKVVVALMTAIGYAALTGVMGSLTGNGDSILAVGLGGATIAALMGYLMLNAPSVAQSLLSGNAVGLGGMSNKLAGGAGSIAGQVDKGTKSGFGAAAKSVVGSVRGKGAESTKGLPDTKT